MPVQPHIGDLKDAFELDSYAAPAPAGGRAEALRYHPTPRKCCGTVKGFSSVTSQVCGSTMADQALSL